MEYLNLDTYLKDHADLSDMNFKGGIVNEKIFGLINFQRSRVENCIFRKVDFFDAHLSYSIFKNCIFETCPFNNLHVYKTEFISCVFLECNFIKFDLSKTLIDNSVFIKGDFKLAYFKSGIIKNSKFIYPENYESVVEEISANDMLFI